MLRGAQIRYLGVGAMLVGGLWALITLRTFDRLGREERPRRRARRQRCADRAYRPRPSDEVGAHRHRGVHRAAGRCSTTASSTASASASRCRSSWSSPASCSARCRPTWRASSGSSNNPVSGITIATILFAALVLMVLPRRDLHHRPGGRGHDRRGGLLRGVHRGRQPAGPQGGLHRRRDAVETAGDAGHRLGLLRADHGAGAQPAGEEPTASAPRRPSIPIRSRRRRPT